MRTPKSIVAAILLGIFGPVAAPSGSRASDGCAPTCTYSWVTKYVDREVSYTKLITLYDHCGRPYKVAKSCCETITAPVRVRVVICD